MILHTKQNKKIAELELEKEQLTKKQVELEEELKRTRDKREFRLKIKEYTGTEYGYYEDIPPEADNTIYTRHRLLVEQYAQANMSPEHIAAMRDIAIKHIAPIKFIRSDVVTWRYVARLDSIIPTPEGTILTVSDPYGSITTKPSQKVSVEQIEPMIGKMIIISLEYNVAENAFYYGEILKQLDIPYYC